MRKHIITVNNVAFIPVYLHLYILTHNLQVNKGTIFILKTNCTAMEFVNHANFNHKAQNEEQPSSKSTFLDPVLSNIYLQIIRKRKKMHIVKASKFSENPTSTYVKPHIEQAKSLLVLLYTFASASLGTNQVQIQRNRKR